MTSRTFPPKHRRQRGEITTVLLVVLAAMVIGPKLAPKFFDERTRDAEASKDASAEVEQRVAAAVAGEERKAAVVAASVNQITASAAAAPDSPQRTFILREGAWLSPLMPAPDPAALQAAYERRLAVEQRRTEQADKLYRQATKEQAELLAENVKLAAKLNTALAERREVDTRLAEAAAAQRARDLIIGGLGIIALVLAAGWIYAKANGLGPADLGRLATRIREGWSPIQAIDATVPDRLHRAVAKAAKLESVDPR